MKEITNTNIRSYDSRECAELRKIEKLKNYHEKVRNKEEMRKLLSPRK